MWCTSQTERLFGVSLRAMAEHRPTFGALSLLTAALMAPVGVAAYLVGGNPGLLPEMLLVAQADTARESGVQERARGRDARLLTGVLSGTGEIKVGWDSRRITVEDGSYAYVGGESIQTGTDAMGVLELAGGNRVYICPDSELSLTSSAPDGSTLITMAEGHARVEFSQQSAFWVSVSGMIFGRALQNESKNEEQVRTRNTQVVAEVVASPSRVAVCELSGDLSYSSGGVPIPTSGSGQIVVGDVPGLQRRAMPSEMADRLSAEGPGGGAQAYLCRCDEIEEFARRKEEADGVAAGVGDNVAPEVVPKVVPPEPPTGLVVVSPDRPNVFDLFTLPPPAAGPGDALGGIGAGNIVAAAPVAPSVVAGGSVLGSAE